MAKYRPPEYCLQCGKQLTPIYRDQSNIPFMQRIIGDTFMGYKPCECSVKLPIKTEGEASQVTYAAVSPVYKNLVEGWYEDAKGTPFQIIKLSAPPSPIKTDGGDDWEEKFVDWLCHELRGTTPTVIERIVDHVQRYVRPTAPHSPVDIDVEELAEVFASSKFHGAKDETSELWLASYNTFKAGYAANENVNKITVEWLNKLKPDYDNKDSYQHGFHDAIDCVKKRVESIASPQSSTGGLPKLDEPILNDDDVDTQLSTSEEEEDLWMEVISEIEINDFISTKYEYVINNLRSKIKISRR